MKLNNKPQPSSPKEEQQPTSSTMIHSTSDLCGDLAELVIATSKDEESSGTEGVHIGLPSESRLEDDGLPFWEAEFPRGADVAPSVPVTESFPATFEEFRGTTMANDSSWRHFNTDNWKIVSRPLCASTGRHFKGGCWSYQQIEEIEWTPSQASPRQGFSNFANLPLEIRRKIWKMAMPEPRIVQYDDVTLGSYGRLLDGLIVSMLPQKFGEEFQACRESLGVFEECYRRHVPVQGYNVFFSCKYDTLVIDLADLLRPENNVDLSYVENLAICSAENLSQEKSILPLIEMACPNLKKFTVVIGHISSFSTLINAFSSVGDVCLRLVDVNVNLGYLNVFETWHETFQFDPPDSPATLPADALAHWIDEATEVRRCFREDKDKDPKRWQGVEFRVCKLGHEAIENEWGTMSYYWLCPLRRIPYAKAFVTTRFSPPILTREMFFADYNYGDAAIECYQGGELVTPYDDLDLLFAEEGVDVVDEEQVVEGENWVNINRSIAFRSKDVRPFAEWMR